MELVKGQLVTSRKGRDVTRLYMVVGEDNGRVLLANGAKWTLSFPKRKNARHLQPINRVLSSEDYQSDVQLKTVLTAYEAKNNAQ